MWWMVAVSITAFIRTKAANKGVLTEEESLVVIEWVSMACIDEECQVEFFLNENISHARLRTYCSDCLYLLPFPIHFLSFYLMQRTIVAFKLGSCPNFLRASFLVLSLGNERGLAPEGNLTLDNVHDLPDVIQ